MGNWLAKLNSIHDAIWRKKEPSQMEYLKQQGRMELINTSLRSTIDEEQEASGEVDFVFQTTKDPWILGLFDPASPQYCDFLMPIAPFFQSNVFLTYITEHQARTYKRMLDCAILQLQNQVEKPEDFSLLQSLRAYGYMRINDSVNGFKMDKETTKKRIVEIPSLEKK